MTRRPEPSSPWARYCPDAWPREWLDRTGELPVGFTRPADPHEADLITGRTTEAAYRSATGRGERPVRAPVPRPDPKGKSNPVVRKLLGYRQFFDTLADLDAQLSPGAVALWCWLWTCEGKGEARCTTRKLGARFRVAPSTATRWLAELTGAGLVEMVCRGRTGQSASLVRVRATVPRAERQRSADGAPALHQCNKNTLLRSRRGGTLPAAPAAPRSAAPESCRSKSRNVSG